MGENKNHEDTFGTSTQDPYLQKTLVMQGAHLAFLRTQADADAVDAQP